MREHRIWLNSKKEYDRPVLYLAQGDANTCAVRFEVERYQDGVDLANLVWTVEFENAAGTADTVLIGRGEAQSEGLTQTVAFWWIPGVLVTAETGIVAFRAHGVADGGYVWNSAKRYISVSEGGTTPAYEEEQLTALDDLLRRTVEDLQSILDARDAANAAAARANAAAGTLEDVQHVANLAEEITEENAGSTVLYPSIKAVVDYIENRLEELTGGAEHG